MTKLDHFEHSQCAMQRSAWKSRQSVASYEASQEMIRKSVELLDEMRRLPHNPRIAAE